MPRERLEGTRNRALPAVISEWLARQEGEPFDRLTLDPPVLDWVSVEATVRIAYRQIKTGATIRRILPIPVNAESNPFAVFARYISAISRRCDG